MGPSGVRKYLADMAGRVKQVIDGDETMIRLQCAPIKLALTSQN